MEEYDHIFFQRKLQLNASKMRISLIFPVDMKISYAELFFPYYIFAKI